jgi:hypothetical protein
MVKDGVELLRIVKVEAAFGIHGRNMPWTFIGFY